MGERWRTPHLSVRIATCNLALQSAPMFFGAFSSTKLGAMFSHIKLVNYFASLNYIYIYISATQLMDEHVHRHQGHKVRCTYNNVDGAQMHRNIQSNTCPHQARASI